MGKLKYLSIFVVKLIIYKQQEIKHIIEVVLKKEKIILQ